MVYTPCMPALHIPALVALLCPATRCMSMPRRAVPGHNHVCVLACPPQPLTGGAGDHLQSPQRMQRMHEPQDYRCSPRGPARDIFEDSEIPRTKLSLHVGPCGTRRGWGEFWLVDSVGGCST